MALQANVVRVSMQPKSDVAWSDHEQQMIAEICETIDISDKKTVLQFGIAIQAEIARFTATVLAHLRTQDSSQIDHIIAGLKDRISDHDVQSLTARGGVLSSLPVIGDMLGSFKRFLVRHQALHSEIQNMTDELEQVQSLLASDVLLLDRMCRIHQDHIQRLSMTIHAGEQKFGEIDRQILPQLQTRLDETRDVLVEQEYLDLRQMASQLDKRLVLLKSSRAIALQTGLHVQFMFEQGRTLLNKIQYVLQQALPQWKNQIIITIAALRPQTAPAGKFGQRKLPDDQLLSGNNVLPQRQHNSATDGKELDMLKKVDAILLDFLGTTLRIYQEGQAKRQQIEKELVKIEMDLKRRLTKPV